ncbi:MAG: hypothetical protein V5A43_09260 [Haloarculaceae archaeon]
MATLEFADSLEPLGIVAGVLLVLFGLGTVVGQPWTTKSPIAVLVQLIGVVAMIAVGVGLVWLSRTE